ncbi:MAG: GGDEF domain-containing protein [Planctomycetaceae bacterium]
MANEPVSVALVGLDPETERALAADEGFTVRAAPDVAGARGADAVVLALAGGAPIESVRAVRDAAPDAAVIVVTDGANAADGAIATHAGAEDHLVRDELLPALLPRAIRYAVAVRSIRRDLATTDHVTRLPNLRGFAPIAEHHLRMADRQQRPVVFVFVRLEDLATIAGSLGAGAADDLARDAAAVVLEAVRDADVPARIAPDTIAVLLTGDAEGAETTVLSRLVEAMAVHDAARERPRALALSVGTARYEPGSGADLGSILAGAARGLARRAG